MTIFLISLLVILAGGMIKLLGRATQETNLSSSIATIAQSKIEDMRNQPYNNITIGNQYFTSELPANLPQPKTGRIDTSLIRTGLKQITVTISVDGNVYTYVTYVSENGINS